jgi:hypothetical protein
MLGDLSVIGPQATQKVHVAASATRYYAGEPMIQDSVTWTSGAASANVHTVAAIDCVVVGTDVFGGIAMGRALPLDSGTLVAHTVNVAKPIPLMGRIRGNAESAAAIDTDAELLAIMQDMVLVDYDATGSPSSGPLYTIAAAAADTSAFQVIDGNTTKGTIDVTVVGNAYRFDFA